MLRKQILISLIFVVAMVVNASGGGSSVRELTDPADSGLKMDISLVRYAQHRQHVARLTIKTHARWRCRDLRPAADTQLTWFFDGGGPSDAFDLAGDFVCRDGDLLFKLHSWGGSEDYEPIVARKLDRRTVQVKMPLDLAEFDDDRAVRLVAKSADHCGKTCVEDCVDWAPDEGRL